MDTPKYIIIENTANMKEWDNGIESNMLHKISHVCYKYMIPNILCPWGTVSSFFTQVLYQLTLCFNVSNQEYPSNRSTILTF